MKYSLIALMIMFLTPFPVFSGEGKKSFKSSCHTCHIKNQASYAPIDKASSQWTRFFKRKKHKRKTGIVLVKTIHEKDLKIILNYLMKEKTSLLMERHG